MRPPYVSGLLFAFAVGLTGVLAGAFAMAQRANQVMQIGRDVAFHSAPAGDAVAGRMGLIGAQVAIVTAFTVAALGLVVFDSTKLVARRWVYEWAAVVAVLWPLCFLGPVVLFWSRAWEYELIDRSWPKVLFSLAALKTIAWMVTAVQWLRSSERQEARE